MPDTQLPRGTLKRIHVNQPAIAQCRRDGTDAPTLTVQTSRGPLRARRVVIDGPSTLVQSLDRPLACGARVWLETRAALTLTT